MPSKNKTATQSPHIRFRALQHRHPRRHLQVQLQAVNPDRKANGATDANADFVIVEAIAAVAVVNAEERARAIEKAEFTVAGNGFFPEAVYIHKEKIVQIPGGEYVHRHRRGLVYFERQSAGAAQLDADADFLGGNMGSKQYRQQQKTAGKAVSEGVFHVKRIF